MNKYRQTAAELDNMHTRMADSYSGKVASIGCAFFVATGIAAALLHWWSN